MASTWLGDHQGRPPVPYKNSLHKQHMVRYQVLIIYLHAILLLTRSRDKTDFDVIRENHKFLWDEEEDTEETWYVLCIVERDVQFLVASKLLIKSITKCSCVDASMCMEVSFNFFPLARRS